VSPRAWLLFAAVSFLWGIPYLLIRVAVDELSPAVVVLARTALGAALLLPLAWRLGALRGLGRRRRDLAVLSLTAIAIPFTLITAGEQWVSSSLTAILIAVEPMAVALMAIRLDPSERVGGARMLGMGAGALGLVTLLGLDLGSGGLALLGAAMIVAAACLYGFASLQVRLRFAGASPLALAAVTLTVSSLVLAVPAALTAPERAPSADAVWALTVLGVACTALALVLYFALVGEVGAGRATVITYAAPAVAVVLGAAVLDERVGPWTVAGLALIALGSWLATRRGAAGRVEESGGLAAN
jgi:drug/metabolite transporter (DMT)-like permease